MPNRPAPPCIVAPSGDPRVSYLYLEKLSKEDKAAWIQAANASQLSLAEWVQQKLNEAAGVNTPPLKEPSSNDSSPETGKTPPQDH